MRKPALREGSDEDTVRIDRHVDAMIVWLKSRALQPGDALEVMLNALLRIHGHQHEQGQDALEDALEDAVKLMRQRRQGDA